MKRTRYTKEKIYDLLPSIYRIRDKEQGEPLKALLEIIAEQVELVERDIEKLYSNWFIETCDEWIVPYIGDLLQTKILNAVTKSISSHRSWVANTISYRRRKGTVATLEQLSRDVTGWNCKAVEFFQNLITTQYLNHIRPEPKATVDMRDKDLLEMISTPFDRSAHTLDVRHIDSKRGYYNIANIGIFLWRLQAYPVIDAPAFSLGEGKYTFSQLGYDLPIYNHPETETGIDHITTELNVPTKIRRTALKEALDKYCEAYRSGRRIKFAYEESIKIVKSVSVESANGERKILQTQIPPEALIVCDLSRWHHRPPAGNVAIDPELGRIIFPESEKVVDVHVHYYYGFSGDIGGGFYDRKVSGNKDPILSGEIRRDFYHYRICKKNHEDAYSNLGAALEKWNTEPFHDSRDVIFEIIDSEIYSDSDTDGNNIIPVEIEIPANVTVLIRSENLCRPVYMLNKPITVIGSGSGSRIIFDGILFVLTADISDQSVGQLYDNNNTILKIAKGDLSELKINHCTFVPARSEAENGGTQQENLGRLVFTWENIPQIDDDVNRLKKYLFDILNEEWIMEDGVVFSKTASDNHIIEVLPPGTDKPSIVLELNEHSYFVSIKRSGIEEAENLDKFHSIYKVPFSQLNDLTKVYSSLYSVGIFGNGSQDINIKNSNNNDNNTNRNSNDSLKISINRSILGRIDTISCGAGLKIVDSIVDGKGGIEAISCTSINIENATIFGKIFCIILGLAGNSIFTDAVNIDRRQQGCVRFCYIPYDSQIPRPYRCVLEYQSKIRAGNRTSEETSDSIPNMKNQSGERRIRPQFTSTNYCDYGYAQLQKDIDTMIFEGGDNGSEIGVFNHLYNPQRIKNLPLSINEYLKFGLEAGLFLVT